MNHTPAGGGLDHRAEFITEDSIHDSMVVNVDGQWKALLRTRQTLVDIIHRVHNTYHAEGVAKPGAAKPGGTGIPWTHCHRTVCREAKALIDELDEGGYK